MSKQHSNNVLTHDRYTSVVSPLGAKVDAETIYAKRKPRGKLSRWSTHIAATFIVTMIAMMGFVQQSPPASAGFWDGLTDVLCGTTESSWVMERHDSGLRALGVGDPFLQSLGYESNSKGDPSAFNAYRHTAYEKYGMSGSRFTFYNGRRAEFSDEAGNRAPKVANDPRNEMWACLPGERLVSTSFANAMFTVTKMVTGVSIWVYGQALNPAWADDIMDGAALIITGDDNVQGLRDGLYFNMLGLVILSSAIYLMGPLFKRQFMNVGSNVVWLVGATAIGGAIMYAPQFLPNLGQALVTEFTTAIHNTTTGAVLGKVSADKDKNFCFVDNAIPDPKSVNKDIEVSKSTIKNVRAMECSMWSVFVYSPWVAGQFGVSSSEAASLATDSGNPTGRATAADETKYAVDLGKGKSITGNMALYQLDMQSYDALDVPRSEGSENFDARTNNMNSWLQVADEVLLDMPEISDTWSGSAGIDRIAVSSAAILTSIFGLIIVVVLSASLLVYKVGVILLIAVSPLFLLMGAHAGFGRGITFKWLGMLAGMFLKSIFTSLFLGIAMMFFAIITQLHASNKLDFGAAMLAIIIISIGMLLYRKPLVNMFGEVNLPGSRGSIGLEAPQGLKSAGNLSKNVAIGAGFGALGAMGASKVAAKAAASSVKTSAATAAASGGPAIDPRRLAAQQRVASGAARLQTLARGAGGGVTSRAAGIEGFMATRQGANAAHGIAKEYAAKDSASRDTLDPALIARRAREEQSGSDKYASDYNAMHDNKDWRDGFMQTYGIEPPNPQTHDFKGYGKRFDRETPEGREQWDKYKPSLRPQSTPTGTKTTPVPTPTPSSAGPIPTRTTTRSGSVPTPGGRPETPKAPAAAQRPDGKILPPEFAQMNKEAVRLREMEQAAPPRGEAGTPARAVWEQHQRQIGAQQDKVWKLQDRVGLGNLKRLGNVQVTAQANRPMMPPRPNL